MSDKPVMPDGIIETLEARIAELERQLAEATKAAQEYHDHLWATVKERDEIDAKLAEVTRERDAAVALIDAHRNDLASFVSSRMYDGSCRAAKRAAEKRE